MVEALDIQVKGIVQGVGFRPFVYRMAKKYLINGWVLNAADGVRIHAEGESKLLDEFVVELSEHAPAAAQVAEIDLAEVPLQDCASFEIRFSDEGEVARTTLVSPELATCDDCVRELFNPNDRRYRYPFINCTNCGPRFTIIDRLPYDRKDTSMKRFEMCERCAGEYGDPLDRRFHAQPNACFECGPHVSLVLTQRAELLDAAASRTASDSLDGGSDLSAVRWGRTREESDAIFARAVDVLRAGGVLAVKGLGGFHLACDAGNAQAVAALRARKHREGKAFAVMVPDIDAALRACEVSAEERAVLEGPQRPIVLLRKRRDVAFTPGLADGLSELGVMLPYTPVQHLLLHDFAEACRSDARPGGALPPMLVMTSGNIHDEPIVTDDAEAYEKLADMADAFLGNDRAILTRFDDSVVRVIEAGSAGSAVQFIRRARGYAPQPVSIAGAAPHPGEKSAGADAAAAGRQPALFAAGPEQKNTFALARSTDEGAEAFVSQHIGDMENAETYDAWLATKQRFEDLFELETTEIACDMHPEYLATKWAHEQAESACRSDGSPLRLEEVQHHHAHIAAVMGEHGLDEAVCGVAFDGTGYGVDGAIWGGEVLLANRTAFERFANFAYVPMPGGAAAVKNPLRMAYGVLWAYDLLDHPGAQRTLDALGDQARICDAMIEQGINMTSSVGRLFDAASALLGICTKPTYEGEGACLLEAAIGGFSVGYVERDAAVSGASGGGLAAVGAPSSGGFPAADAAASAPSADAHADTPHEALPSTAPSPEERAVDAALSDVPYEIAVVKNTATETSTAQDTSVLLLDAEPAFRALLDDLEAGVPTVVMARRFHDAFVNAVVTTAELVRALYGIGVVALSGGVFMNRYIVQHVLAALEKAGFTAAISRDLPPNDGCISYGQAVIAWARKNDKS